MRSAETKTATATGVGTVYSDPITPDSGATVVAATVKRASGSDTPTVTVQGALAKDAADANWVDTTFTLTIADSDVPQRIPDSVSGDDVAWQVWPHYRFKVVAGAAVSVECSLLSL